MDIKDYAKIVLAKNDNQYRMNAIKKLKDGLHEEVFWDYRDKQQVWALIIFLESPSMNINDLEQFVPFETTT